MGHLLVYFCFTYIAFTTGYNPDTIPTKTGYVESATMASLTFEVSGCGAAPVAPANAIMRCSQYSGCRVSCLPKHRFPNGEIQLFVTCQNGGWQVEGTEWPRLPACEPVCMPDCQNNGICVAPDRCHCAATFSGPQCQYEKRPCLNYPMPPLNSRRTCSSSSCTVTCMKGYEFPDGSAIATMECKDGQWVPSRSNWVSVPNCQATCTPECQNGGNCLSYNVCQCPQQYRGPQCQYSANACNGRAMNFNGGYNCSGDSEMFQCSLKCPPGVPFTFEPAVMYTCRYSEGLFTPSPIPQCQFLTEVEPLFSKTFGGHISAGSIQWSQGVQYGQIYRSSDNSKSSNELMNGSNMKNINKGLPIESLSKEQFNLPTPTTCLTWAGTHYKTFDGEVFSVESPCAHILVRDAIDDTFSVIRQTSPIQLHIYANNRDYILKKSEQGMPVLTAGSKRLPIPVQAAGFRADMSAHFVVVSLDSVGLTLKWNGEMLVQVLASEALWNKTEGLCGRANGKRFDDMLKRDGYKANNPGAFLSSWQADTIGKACTTTPTHEHKCDASSELNDESYNFCKKMMSELRFAACLKKMDLSMMMDACRWDYCACMSRGVEPAICVCNTLDVFVRECRHRGVKSLTNWRDEKLCPLTCSGGRQYMPCGPPSGQSVCASPPPSVNTATTPEGDQCAEEGCYCPAGEVLGEGACINRDQCPCWLRGKTFQPGQSVPKDCNTCTCAQGQWTCTQISCSARCSAVGDPHYTTFDGRTYDFMGQCSYYLLKTDEYTIEVENVACAGAISRAMNLPVSVSAGLPSCTKSVTVRMPKNTVKLGQNQAITVDGKEVDRLPAGVDDATIRLASSIYIVMELANGLEIWWDGMTRVYIEAPATFRDKTTGLCGTFNANQKDDFITPEGDIEQSAQLFANKWKTNANCPDVKDDKSLTGPCEVNIQNKELAEKHCSVIKSELFTKCHWSVEPDTFYKNCLYDMCSCGSGVKLSDCLCANIAAYGQECADKNIIIDWRNIVRECGLVCPTGQEYTMCGDPCRQTCADLTRTSPCKKRCVEGCTCVEGQVLNDRRECVPITQCPCQREGFEFPAGYKEIRPGSKTQELCVCTGAMWSCSPASPEDIFKYPKANDVKTVCSTKEHQEFTTCEPAEAVTCGNMHILSEESPAICHPGCICKKGYVLASRDGTCVQPAQCPCHHGGKSYGEDDTVQNDCNTCTCKTGKWQCTDRICSSVCSAWGDSHYKTFDGRMYEYQGQCDYLFAKGALGGADEFDVSIQNVQCSSLGISCSKSVTLAVAGGDSITLTSGRVIPKLLLNRTVVRQSDVFTIVEVEDLGLTLHWDRGTRVYLRLDSRWKGKTRGLCGNYNNDQLDDFQTPSGGVNEVSPALFGDSWRLKPYCPSSVQVIDACASRPERKSWALRKCGVLKTDLFAPCRSEVPVEDFLERCVFDTCACDQGGDCECLCTALAAYAQECNTHGVPIKWRSKDLCPMQCDERCSTYTPCMSSCPVETCDTSLTINQSGRLCAEDTCIEGCARKPCEEGFVYANSTTSECVPRSTCKPKCMEKYYEGDLIEEDDCQRCHCTRNQKVCVGKPCVPVGASTTTVVPPEDQQLSCIPGWTDWINQDGLKPLGRKLIDVEPIPDSVVLNQLNPSTPKCAQTMMKGIECRTITTHIDAKSTGLDVECSLENGLICSVDNTTQKPCPDFEIRVLCECKEPVCDVSKPNTVHESDCQRFYQCVEGGDGLEKVEKACANGTLFNPTTQVCDWPAAVINIRPECAEFKCPPGSVYSNCAIACERMCNYYEYVVHASGLCTSGELCEEGCVKETRRSSCSPNMYWRDNTTCVKASDCTCRSNTGNAIQPGMIFQESQCELCQCIDNQYICDTSTCETTRVAATKKPHEKKKPTATGAELEGQEAEVPEQSTTTVEPEEAAEASEEEAEELPIITSVQPKEETLVGLSESEPVETWPTSTVTPPALCKPNEYIYLVDGPISLPDSAFTASTTSDSINSPWKSRMHSSGSWSPLHSNRKQYLQIDLGAVEPVYGLTIAGHPIRDEYITSYRVLHSLGPGHRFTYVTDTHGIPKIFRGGIDNKTPVVNMFDVPFEAHLIRINPYSWHKRISMRADAIGCSEVVFGAGESSFRAHRPESTAIVVPVPHAPFMCDEPMGIKDDRTFTRRQLEVSSMISRAFDKKRLQMDDANAWQPASNIPNQWVQFDLLALRNVTGVVTKGGPDGWVSAYEVKYSPDMKNWQPILDDYSNDKLFLGNFDENTPQSNYFDRPIRAQYIRVFPKKWQKNIQLRAEVRGCFEPYSSEDIYLASAEEYWTTTTTTVTSIIFECNYCPGVETARSGFHATCPCTEPFWWNGDECVMRSRCPCVLGHIVYTVGSSFLTEDCAQCICALGGVPKCEPKVCDTCNEGLRSMLTSTCGCICKPCAPDQTICPTSNTCLNNTSWCDGVVDCPDDEINCYQSTTITTLEPATSTEPTYTTHSTEPTTLQSSTISVEVVECPVPKCPPGYMVQIRKPSLQETLHSNLMFRTGITAKKSPVEVKGRKGSHTKNHNKSNYLPRVVPTKLPAPENGCLNFKCVSTRPLPEFLPPGRTVCPPADCPPGYTSEMDTTIKRSRNCPTYWCKPAEIVKQQQQTAVCNVTGRTINTFDGTEFKLDICKHILARDLSPNSEWVVTLGQQCLASCVRHLVLLHGDRVIKAYMDLSLEYNGYNFTVEHASRIGAADRSLSMSRVGNALLFISHQFGFWVQWDKYGDVKIGVTPTLENKIDGLCGLYNGDASDDKRMPNGKLTHRTAEFGESWRLDQSEECSPRTCPLHLQEIAWKMCLEALNDVFKACHKSLDPNVWASRCLETTCTCLEKANGTEAKKACRCDALGMYASDCAGAGITTDDWLGEWRLRLDCQAECPAPLIFHDCYRHRCEPTCANIGDESSCIAVPGMCFPGCYCPSGYVRHKKKCIPPSECRDCECNVLPYLQYVTYDNANFTVISNCSYVVTQDIGNDFTLLSSNAPCVVNPNQMCVDRLILVLAGGRHVVVITHGDTPSHDFVVSIDGAPIKVLPVDLEWLQVKRLQARHLNLQALGGKFELRVYHPTFGFSVRMPSHVYGGRLVGLCGDCNRDPDNDFRVPAGKVVNDVEEFARSWQTNATEEETSCVMKDDECALVPMQRDDPCEGLLDEDRFGRCHILLDPAIFVATCRHETCNSRKDLACQSLETYAIACAKLGVCVDWHIELCPPRACPAGTEYRLCGDSCPATCEQPVGCGSSITEGCFCVEEGVVLKNNTSCVQPTACEPCDAEGHYPGDVWHVDDCTACACDEISRSVHCQTQQCPEVVCGRRFEAMPQEEQGAGECCAKVVCVPVQAAGPTCEPPTQRPSCGADQVLKLDRGADGCQQFICECKAADECESIEEQEIGSEPIEDKVPDVGMERVIDSTGCCPVLKWVCRPEKCPTTPHTCPKFYKSVEEDLPNRCCPVFKCHAPTDKCLYELKYAPANDGGERDRTALEREATAAGVSTVWTDGPCRTCNCELDDNNNTQAQCTRTQCTNLNDSPDHTDYVLQEVPVYNQCCPEVQRVACRDPNTGTVYDSGAEWRPNSTDPCNRAKCIETTTGVSKTTTLISCDEHCDIGWKYDVVPTQCCGECRQYACVVPETNELKQIGDHWTHLCTNYQCIKGSNNTISVQMESIKCPEAPDQKYMYELKPAEKGHCCGSYIRVACLSDEGIVHGEGAEWSTPNSDRCKRMKCVRKHNQITQIETTIECKTDCPLGHTYTPSPAVSNECCGQCIQTACIANDSIAHKPNEQWSSLDGCTTFTCNWFDDITSGTRQLTVTASQDTCPDVTQCPPNHLYQDGCCEKCNITTLPFVRCAPEAIAVAQTVGIVKQTTQTHGKCANVVPVRHFMECHGMCESSTEFNGVSGVHESVCYCCQAIRYEGVVIELICEDGYRMKKQLAMPVECGCETCSSLKHHPAKKSSIKNQQHSSMFN